MFSTSMEAIEKARQEGVAERTTRMMEGYYTEAEKRWQEKM